MDALDGRLDEFVQAVGTAGSFSGNAEYLKEHVIGIRCYPVEPEKAQVLAGKPVTGGHRLEGMGSGIIPGICRLDLADGTLPVSDEEAMTTARLLASKEGIFGGTSSGANVFAALQRAKLLGVGKRVVTIICDSGLKYLEGDLYGQL